MMKRPRTVDFAPNAFVFPGGVLHEADHSWPDPFRAAAIRELFEEMGILLARRSDSAYAGQAEADAVAAALADGQDWNRALAELELTPDLAGLTFFTHWITPVLSPRRYDTRFYIGRLPERQEVRPSPHEVAGWRWVDPDRATDSGLHLIYATQRVLEIVGGVPDWNQRLASLARLNEVRPIRPRVERDSEGRFHVVGEELLTEAD